MESSTTQELIYSFFQLLPILSSIFNLVLFSVMYSLGRSQRLFRLYAYCLALIVVLVLLNVFGEYQLIALVALSAVHLLLAFLVIFQEMRYLQMENIKKDQELDNKVKELKATQLKFLEAGKVSTAAALSAGILHQISQPITAIHGFTRFMKQEMGKDERFYKPVVLMEEQTVYLKEMLENLMTLIRHRKVEKANIQVNRVVERAVNLLLDELRIRRVRWDLNLGHNIPDIYADAVHLQQVFMNICVNAMEALSLRAKGEERHLVITSEYNAEDRHVMVIFHNNGPQISEEIKSRIFEPFFTNKEKGSGIGLALCHDLLAEHGGKMTVENSPDGVTFYVHLPVAKAAVGA